jgi:DNA topoisomerase-1
MVLHNEPKIKNDIIFIDLFQQTYLTKMSKPLIIVESYTKTKTISKYLDNKYTVICSLGHINDLPKTDIGIDTTTWSGTYVPTKQKIISDIRTHVRNASAVYLASDPDMEGEAIAYHIKQNIQDLLNGKQCSRIKFHEITKRAVIESISHPQDINQNVVDAQEARRFIDRLIGYKLSPILWNQFNDNTLSVGRVQSVALSMCVSLLQKIQSSDIESFWLIIGVYNKLPFKLYHTETIYKAADERQVHQTLALLDFATVTTPEYKESTSTESPGAPYTTTSLQQDAYTKHRFTSKKTMQLAQDLYENGHITYMRTDSTNISPDFKNVIAAYIKENYGDEYVKFRSYKNKIANAQEAHEAVRVTTIKNLSTPDLSDDHNKLYKLIWKRTVASMMPNAEYINLDVIIMLKSPFKFIYRKSFLAKAGYLILYGTPETIQELEAFKNSCKNLKPSEYKAEANISNIPSLYNEVALIKALEKEGIGRPSTYASIIDKIISKKYVEKGQNPQKDISVCDIIKSKNKPSALDRVQRQINTGGKQKDLLVPTQLGMTIIQYLQDKVPFLLDITFTANMEGALDRICDQIENKTVVLSDFYQNHLLPVLPATPLQQPSKQPKQKTSGIIKTKYGYCYYHASSDRYTNIESYLKWREISADALSDKDIKFLRSLPKKIGDDTYLCIGQYGLYIKEKNKNVRLDKNKWADYL